MISLATIRQVIHKSERDYMSCWSFLAGWKDRSVEFSAKEFFDFQPRLANAMFRLGELHQDCSKEKRKLIERKTCLSPAWFARRMKKLADYENVIAEAIKMGRILGDSFTWIFYQDDRKALRKHFQRPPITQVPTGLGGKGELAFISKVQTWNNHLTIYHGITSFLRIGDVSFYDPQSKRITAIGEIKTETQTGSEFGMKMYLLWSRGSARTWRRAAKPSNRRRIANAITLPANRRDQLKKQLKKMAASLEPHKPKELIQFHDQTYFAEFTQLVTELKSKTLGVQKLGDGLLLFGVQGGRERSLFRRLLPAGKVDFNKRLPGIELHARQIIDMTQVEAPDHANRIFVGSLDLTGFPGTTPMFWWPVPTEFVRKLVFHEITIVAVYNPAHLVRKIRTLGFEVELDRTQQRARKILGTAQLEMGNIAHFLHYIQQHLLKEEFVLRIFQSILERAESGKIPSNTYIDLETQLHY